MGIAQNNFTKSNSAFWRTQPQNTLSTLVDRGFLLEIDVHFTKLFDAEDDLKLGLAYLFAASRQGHLCIKIKESLFPPLERVLMYENESLPQGEREAIEKIILNGFEACTPEFLEKNPNIQLFENHLYLNRNLVYESDVYEAFKQKEEETPNLTVEPRGLSDSLLDGQRSAITESLKNSVHFIVGGPGVGKTFTASHLLKAFLTDAPEAFVGIFAPTGKAVANLESAFESLKEEVSESRLRVCTLHKLFSQKIHSYLPYDLMLIDESSMIDLGFMRKLFLYAKPKSRIIFLGDPNQLPPIESGCVFHDLVEKTKHKSILDVCQRVEGKELIEAAEHVRKKQADLFLSFIEKQKLFHTLDLKNKESVVHELLPLFPQDLSTLSPLELLKAFNRAKVLTPMRSGPFGVDALNEALKDYFYGHKAHPILITSNDYRLELFNGDVGVKSGSHAYFFARSEEVSYYDPAQQIRVVPLSILPNYEYAYVLSIHKSQGSEYDEVAILLPEGSEVFGKELLYTAITRAKKRFDIFSDPNTLQKVVQSSALRYSGFHLRGSS